MASPVQNQSALALSRIESCLEGEPARIDLQIERARLLIDLERHDEAKDTYLSILTQDPTQLVALNNLGALLNIMGYHKAALKVYREVVKLDPTNLKVRMNLADSLRDAAELEEARGQYEIILRQHPDNKNAHRGLSYVLLYLGEKEKALELHKKAFGKQPVTPAFSSKDGSEGIVRVLVLASPCGGNSPITQLLDKKAFQVLNIVPDFHDPSLPLPPHRLMMNAIGDADQCASSLEAAQFIAARWATRILNSPARILTTGRVENSRLLGQLDGVVTPRIAILSREVLTGPNACSLLLEQGFNFPLLLRTPGFHEGSHFVRVESPEALPHAVSTLPGQRLLVIEYLDARDDDGKIRKYRVMMIDGKLYPLHKAVSQNWMIHFSSADMAHSPAHRAEDAAFLEDMPGVLGHRAMQALARIQEALGLDYAGADFSLGKSGEVLLFEANATMVIPTPDKGEKWDYRRDPVRKIQTAAREMILSATKA
jgi:Flp pilus assembly protein TadD